MHKIVRMGWGEKAKVKRQPVGKSVCCTSLKSQVRCPEFTWKARYGCRPVTPALWGRKTMESLRFLGLQSSSKFSDRPHFKRIGRKWYIQTFNIIFSLCTHIGKCTCRHTPTFTHMKSVLFQILKFFSTYKNILHAKFSF